MATGDVGNGPGTSRSPKRREGPTFPQMATEQSIYNLMERGLAGDLDVTPTALAQAWLLLRPK